MKDKQMNETKTIRFLPTILLILAVVFFLEGNGWCANNYYVAEGGTGTSCSRQFPCYFAYAIGTKAVAGDSIFFKEGKYKRTAESVVRIEKDLYLYGGWNGVFFGDPVINPELYETILDGENERPVVQILGAKAIVSGFTIQYGKANAIVVCVGDFPATGCGGGIYAYEAEAIIASNKILYNTANEDKGNGGAVHLESTSGTYLMNNLIQDNKALTAGGGLSIFGTTSAPPQILQNNRFIHNTAGFCGGIAFSLGTLPTIHGNIFENNTGSIASALYGGGPGDIAHNVFTNHPGGTYVVLLNGFSGNFQNNQLLNNNVNCGLAIAGNPVITNNIIARSGLEYALFVGIMNNAVIEHNTVVGENIGTAFRIKSSTPLGLNNNIISGYPVGIDATDSEGAVIARHALFDSSVTTQAINVTMANSLVGDPAFKDPVANDFHIRMTSAARDAGTANFITTNQDIDGEIRPIGSAPDIGADEFNPSLLNMLYLPLIK